MNILNNGLSNESDLLYVFQNNRLKRNEIFSLLMKYYWQSLYSRCRYRLNDSGSIDDVVQDVLLRIYQALPKYCHQGVFRTWIYTIADNVCYSHLAKKMRYNKKNISINNIEPVSHYSQVNIDDKIDMDILLDELSYSEKEIIDLRFYQDLTLLEISDILCITISACKMRLYRALKLLHGILFRKNIRTISI
ncbi:RNA polymerase subunit sigma-70 [Photobacterium sp. GB-27]|uniref:RNA polymerase sigma factor n=1 Tax=unclassified Photobacterium TaxID=2628852 RepID=UPI000D1679F4|nr:MULTISPECIES: sigma-70 family RNA polymerase sigma factor [unclassified Photobacterium]PSV29706.1 RNA polymerase subunit sigma-70 [Photobacterium sp. GB-72]PSV34952.1 RNA polymerase subunit sigma-70 [Photobacterium sp. GB-27]PSV43047.1 RNA polymerase subunit sigma-70 [Photobacterium sp. GB-36]